MMKELIKDFWFFITSPSYWSMNYPYNEDYDRWFNELLDNNKFTKPKDNGYLGFNGWSWLNSDCCVYLGDELFWIGNQPYDCFTSEDSSFNIDNHTRIRYRPSRRTIYKAINKLNKECG